MWCLSLENPNELKDLKTYFSKFKEIKAAYLFGSYVTGKRNRISDLDIAVILNEDKNIYKLKLKIISGIIELGYDNIDLSILNNMSIVGRYEAVKYNQVLYADSDFDVNRFFSLVVREYLDFKPYLEVQRKYLKERIFNDK